MNDMKFNVNKNYFFIALSWSISFVVFGSLIGVFFGHQTFEIFQFSYWGDFFVMTAFSTVSLYWLIISSSKNLD